MSGLLFNGVKAIYINIVILLSINMLLKYLYGLLNKLLNIIKYIKY